MSLAQHVSSTEGADREWIEPLIDEEFPVGPVLSYDPVPPVYVEDLADHVAAYKVRKRIRYGKQLLSNVPRPVGIFNCNFSFGCVPAS